MNYLIDTNHWSYLQRGHPLIRKHIQSLPEESTLYMSVISQGELLFGVELAVNESQKNRLRALYAQTITEMTEIIYVTSQVAERYALVLANLRRKGKPIETNNIWIAATALAYNLILVTNDEHFQYIDGMQTEDWTKA
ncbi:type II toxin-antitoxin system VapC family toxin [Candidatus Poribacteria bacterium]|nr:type II toxin-antitoxin system VapC family toxin [Candidatus Poribacteria bacterium]